VPFKSFGPVRFFSTKCAFNLSIVTEKIYKSCLVSQCFAWEYFIDIQTPSINLCRAWISACECEYCAEFCHKLSVYNAKNIIYYYTYILLYINIIHMLKAEINLLIWHKNAIPLTSHYLIAQLLQYVTTVIVFWNHTWCYGLAHKVIKFMELKGQFTPKKKENSVINYSPLCPSKPVRFLVILGTQLNKIWEISVLLLRATLIIN